LQRKFLQKKRIKILKIVSFKKTLTPKTTGEIRG